MEESIYVIKIEEKDFDDLYDIADSNGRKVLEAVEEVGEKSHLMDNISQIAGSEKHPWKEEDLRTYLMFGDRVAQDLGYENFSDMIGEPNSFDYILGLDEGRRRRPARRRLERRAIRRRR